MSEVMNVLGDECRGDECRTIENDDKKETKKMSQDFARKG